MIENARGRRETIGDLLPSGLRARPVYVTKHAKDRILLRCPEFRTNGRDPNGLAVAEVNQAIREGRFGRNVPRWANTKDESTRDRISQERGEARVAWNAEETRVYVLRLTRDPHRERRQGRSDGKCWTVVTVYSRRAA